MARPGQELVSRSSGERVVFRRTASETGGALLELDFFLQPSRSLVADHRHPRQEEELVVRAGSLLVRRGDDELRLGPGEAARIPPGVTHTVVNDGAAEAHALVRFAPALRTEALFECLFDADRADRGRVRGFLAQWACLGRHRDEMRVEARLHRVLVRVAGALHRAGGGSRRA